MFNPWIIKDINDAMRNKKTKEAIKRRESVCLSEMYPLCTFLLILLLIICVYKCLPFFLSALNIIVSLTR